MPTLYLSDGTAYNKIKKLYYSDGTANSKLKSLYESDGTAWHKVFSGVIKWTYEKVSPVNMSINVNDNTTASFSVVNSVGDGYSATGYVLYTFDAPITITPNDITTLNLQVDESYFKAGDGDLYIYFNDTLVFHKYADSNQDSGTHQIILSETMNVSTIKVKADMTVNDVDDDEPTFSLRFYVYLTLPDGTLLSSTGTSES